MSYIDWNVAQQPEQNLVDLPALGQKSALAGYQLGQTGAAYSALRGVNLSDPNSVQSALSGLTSVGAIDQAKALTDLAYQRGVNQSALPVTQGANQLAVNAIATKLAAQQQAQQPQTTTPSATQPAQSPFPGAPAITAPQAGQAQQTMQAAADAINRVKSAPPEQRAALLDQEAQQFQVAGLDPSAIAAVKAHLADANFSDESLDDLTNHYAEHAQNFGTIAAGGAPTPNLSTHPTNNWAAAVPPATPGAPAAPAVPGAAPVAGTPGPPVGFQNTQQLVASDPNIARAQAELNDPTRDAVVQGAIAHSAGIDLNPGFQQDIALTAPARAAAAQAAFAGTNAYASTTGTNVANFNSLPEVEEAVAKAGAQGASAGTLQDIKMSDGSTRQAVVDYGPNGPYMVPLQGGAGGPAAPTPGATPTPAKAAVNVASGQQYASDLSSAGASMPMQTALRKVVDLLPSTNVGPGVEATNGWRSFIMSQLPALAPLIPGGLTAAQVQTANTNELQKYMTQIASAASGQYGPASDAKLAAAVSGNPHITMDKLSATDVTKTALALQRADLAKPYLFGTTGEDPSQYSTFASNYARTVDPRAFELDMLTPPQRQAMMATITTPADKTKFTRGVQAAEAAGFYNRADLPR